MQKREGGGEENRKRVGNCVLECGRVREQG